MDHMLRNIASRPELWLPGRILSRSDSSREPLPAEAGAVFAGCPNLILTPHIAGVTVESNVRVSQMIARAVAGALGTSERPV